MSGFKFSMLEEIILELYHQETIPFPLQVVLLLMTMASFILQILME